MGHNDLILLCMTTTPASEVDKQSPGKCCSPRPHHELSSDRPARGPGELFLTTITGSGVFRGKTAPTGPKEITGPGPTGFNFELQLQDCPVFEFEM